MHNILDFEKPIAELDAKIAELRQVNHADADLTAEIKQLQKKSEALTEKIFSALSPWQITQLARHPARPHWCDYIENLFTDFDELHGDRHFSDDPAIIGGLARFEDQPVMIIGQEKGRKTQEKLKHNFGMPNPEGYRKALRLMQFAEKFQLPLLTFVDTAGAYPGIGAEERNQSEAIAQNLKVMSTLKTPIICTVIGEGGSGGALALSVADEVMMLQYSIYSVISPEGAASILWKSATKAEDAAAALGVTAAHNIKLGLIDSIVPEPKGGAHRHPEQIYASLKNTLREKLTSLTASPINELLEKRYERLMQYGKHYID